MNLYLLKYNNYFNRTIKKLDTLNEYLVAPYYDGTSVLNCSFNQDNGVTTTHVINGNANNYNYLIASYDGTTIDSRWFITDSKRERTGQYTLSLKRDTIADNYDTIINAPCFIEKGSLKSENPLIYNNEGLTFNQIKTSETLLKDNTQSQWLIAYVPQGFTPDPGTISIPGTSTAAININVPINQWKFYIYSNLNTEQQKFRTHSNNIRFGWNYTFNLKWAASPEIARAAIEQTETSYNGWYDDFIQANIGFPVEPTLTLPQTQISFNTAFKNQYYNQYVSSFNIKASLADNLLFNELLTYNGKLIVDSNGKYYKVSISLPLSYNNQLIELDSNDTSGLYSLMNTCRINAGATRYSAEPNNHCFYVKYNYDEYTITLNEITTLGTSVTINTNRTKTSDALYDIFAMPLDSILIRNATSTSIDYITTDPTITLNFGKALSSQLAGKELYDIQILPYCPIPEIAKSIFKPLPALGKLYGGIDISSLNTNQYSFVDYNDGQTTIHKSILLYVPKASFTFDIKNSIEINRQKSTTYVNNDITELNNFSVTGRSDDHGYGTIDHTLDNWDLNSIVKYPNTIDKIELGAGCVITAESSNIASSNLTYNTGSNTFTIEYEVISGHEEDVSFTLYLNFDKIVLKQYTYDNTYATDIKLSSNCDMYRLCSPNYNGLFELSVAKNNGINYFNVDCTYKPYNPYIHINPNFKGLYGNDFNDSRGLTLGGDFSFGQLSNEWANFELSNKYYQEIFDRDIKNIDVNNSISLQEQAFSGISGTISGGVSGGVAGGVVGGPWGAVAGAVTGVGLGAAGAAIDMKNTKARITENKDYAVSKYTYSLQTIKAQPNSLAKNNAFTANYKGWPFVEYYTCTDIEKEAFKNKLKYDGMTVMAIGTIKEYIINTTNYIKGQLIRLEGLNDNYIIAADIYNEILKGIYLGE